MVTVRCPHVRGSLDTSGPAMSTQGQRAHDALALHGDTIRERLPNGLTVLIRRDPAAPVVAIRNQPTLSAVWRPKASLPKMEVVSRPPRFAPLPPWPPCARGEPYNPALLGSRRSNQPLT
jgi:hypothetical protein